MTGGCCNCIVHSPTTSCRGGGGLGRGGGGGISLVTKSSTTIKDVSGYIVIRGMCLYVVVDRKGWGKLRVAQRSSCLFTPYSGLTSAIRTH